LWAQESEAELGDAEEHRVLTTLLIHKTPGRASPRFAPPTAKTASHGEADNQNEKLTF
jgi:hypothetical protein